MMRAEINHTRRGEAVYNPFMGSGTTLIAAQSVGRRALGVEILPRMVFKFKLVAVAGEEDLSLPPLPNPQRRRIIPSRIKVAVWQRDGGKCVVCGATDELHFDHILPFSKGGTSITAQNVQLLCARHNLQKHDDIV